MKIEWVHGTTTYDKADPRGLFIALGSDDLFHLYRAGVLSGSFGTLAEAKAEAEAHR